LKDLTYNLKRYLLWSKQAQKTVQAQCVKLTKKVEIGDEITPITAAFSPNFVIQFLLRYEQRCC
jgi:hypothetical protein